jgi:hypothetical protein
MKLFALSLSTLLFLGGAAFAQTPLDPPPVPPPEPPVVVPPVPDLPDAPLAPPVAPRRYVRERERTRVYPVERRERRGPPSFIRSWVGLSFQGGGGAGAFFDDETQGITSAQGTWTARFTVGTRRHIAAEAGYLGSAQRISVLGMDRDAALISHGAETALRINLFTGIVQPYIAGGIGWRHYGVRSQINTSAIDDSTNTWHVPLATGIAVRGGGFLVDGRVNFRPTYGSLVPGANLSTWDVTGSLGFEF